jgi:ribosomal protein S18 acetylase RimI-like enzyme
MLNFEIVDGAKLDVDEVAGLYRASTLAERRPVEDREVFAAMVANANLTVTAREDGQLIGFCRSLTDWSYVTYLCDLAVDVSYQRRGIGRELIRITGAAAPRAKIVLLSAPAATAYYPHIGFVRHDSAWVLAAADPSGAVATGRSGAPAEVPPQ